MAHSQTTQGAWVSVGEAAATVADKVEQQSVAAIRDEISRALAEDRVTLHFHRIVDSRNSTLSAFHEALLRVRTAEGQTLHPGQFLPAAASTPLMLALDCRALKLTLDALRDRPDLRLSVNIAPENVGAEAWIAELDRGLSGALDAGYRLIVEITETGDILDRPETRDFLAALRKRGISVALDDFGAGATGFRHFRDYRFDIVKIDGSYGANLDRDADAQALVRALADIARHFDMLTVIEFIARPEDAVRARKLGIDCLQGFHFARPVAELPPDPKAASRTAPQRQAVG